MPKTIISDTSCLILLKNIEELELLNKVYGKIYTTIEIATKFGETLPKWIEIKEVIDSTKQQLLELQIDKGESSAIALALETPNSTVILDDFKARKIALKLGINFTGTIGIIVKAKLIGVIPSITPILKKIQQSNFRLSSDLVEQALKEAKE